MAKRKRRKFTAEYEAEVAGLVGASGKGIGQATRPREGRVGQPGRAAQGQWAEYDGDRVKALKAQVRGGRLVLDEPTELPEGEEVELVPLDEVLANGGDYLDDEERERLHQAIDRGLEDGRMGRTTDARTVVAELRARAAGR